MTVEPQFVLDASLALAWALPDEASAYADEMLRRVATSGAWVPALWPHEMANGLLSAERRHRLTAAQRTAFVEEMLKLPIEVEERAIRAILETQISLAEQFSLTAYEAAYLDLALRKGAQLMTQDKALRAAAARAGLSVAAV